MTYSSVGSEEPSARVERFRDSAGEFSAGSIAAITLAAAIVPTVYLIIPHREMFHRAGGGLALGAPGGRIVLPGRLAGSEAGLISHGAFTHQRFAVRSRVRPLVDRQVRGYSDHSAEICRSVAHVLREQLYYDTAIAGSPRSVLPALQVTTPDHIVFGTDWPFVPAATIDTLDEEMAKLERAIGIVLSDVDRANVLSLFPRLARNSSDPTKFESRASQAVR